MIILYDYIKRCYANAPVCLISYANNSEYSTVLNISYRHHNSAFKMHV